MAPTSSRTADSDIAASAPTRDVQRQGSPARRITDSRAAEQPGESRFNLIAKRAHEIYEARGGEHGKAMEDWLQAEREVDAALERTER